MEKIVAKSWSWEIKGEPENLILKDVNITTLGDNEVIVKNTYIGLNPVDWKLIQGGHPKWSPGIIPGVDGAGIIIQTGKNMKHLRIGARVCYHTDLTKNGSFSTHTIVNGKALIYIPEKISDSVAAAFPCPCLTAWQSFQKIPDITNKNILISGAGGSVGYFITQLALSKGAKVYVTAGEKHHKEFLEMGVIKAVDYKRSDWKKTIINSLNGNLLDVIFDTVSGSHSAEIMDLLGYYGHIVAIQDRVKENPLPAFTTCISLHEIALGAFHGYASEKQISQLMADGEALLNRIGNGQLKLRQQKIDTFDHLPKHLAEMKGNNSEIKYVVKV